MNLNNKFELNHQCLLLALSDGLVVGILCLPFRGLQTLRGGGGDSASKFNLPHYPKLTPLDIALQHAYVTASLVIHR